MHIATAKERKNKPSKFATLWLCLWNVDVEKLDQGSQGKMDLGVDINTYQVVVLLITRNVLTETVYR